MPRVPVTHRFGAALAGLLIAAAGWPAATWAAGPPVYRWTDEHGVVHFSDSPPQGPGSDARVLPPPPSYRAADPREEYFSIINQARRMAEERRARERARLDELRARAEIEAAERDPGPPGDAGEASESRRSYIVPVHPRFHRRGLRADFREFPEGHPAFRPHPWHRHPPSPPRAGRLVPLRR
jgi:hypothetical protein